MDNTLAKLIRASRGPVLLMTLGALLAVHQFTPVSFDRTFPVLIIVFGLMWLLERMVPQHPSAMTVNIAAMPQQPRMEPLPPIQPRDPLAYDPLSEIHRNVYRGDIPPPAPKPVAPSHPVAPLDPNQDIPTAEHPIHQIRPNGEPRL